MTTQNSPLAGTTTTIIISVALLAFILYRQVQVRRATPNPALPLICLALGVVGLVGSNRPSAAKLGILVALLAVDAVGLGALRAWTVKLWRDDNQGVLRQGTWVTVVLWLVGLAIHETVDVIAHIPASSTLLYVGVTFLAQMLVLQLRINRMEQQPFSPAGPGPQGGFAAGPPGPEPETPGNQ
jgi:hypothetical protein